MANFPDNVGPGLFLPTTEIIDTDFITQNEKLDEDLKEMLIRIVQAFNDSNLAMNQKDTGIYSLQEFVNGQTFFPNPTLSSTTAQAPVRRQVFRKVINFGALLNNGQKSVAHGITIDANTTFTRLYGEASDTVNMVYLPIPTTTISGPYSGNIDLLVDNTNVNVETTFDATSFTECKLILEYIKQ